MRVAVIALTALVLSFQAAHGQSLFHVDPDQDRANAHFRAGWDAYHVEDWPRAVKEFQQAVAIKPKFKLAYYGLGRSYMGLKRFVEATSAYETCRSLYEDAASERLRGTAEADTLRQSDLDALRLAINTLSSASQMQTGQQAQATANQIRQLRAQAQRIEIRRDELNNNVSLTSEVPAFVSLALGSAYFRSERLADAERAYKAATDDDPKAGEAWNNLAVVYLLTGRVEEADRAIKTAEKAGFHVNPQLKDDVRKRRSGD
jgi:tetratricopeptide (TPR) repeat protein